MPRRTLTLGNGTSRARRALWQVGDPEGLGRIAGSPDQRQRWTVIGDGVLRNLDTGEEVVSPGYLSQQKAKREHQLEIMGLRADMAREAREKARQERARVRQEKVERDLAKPRTTLKFMNETLGELEALKASGGNVGKELGDSLAGALESVGLEQPGKWIERATYNKVEERLKPKLRLSFMNMFQDLQKGAASDTDLRLMRELDPSVRGISMSQRIDNLRMARDLYQDILSRTTPGETVEELVSPVPQTMGPAVGSVEDGYRFLGGDPANPANWEEF